MRDVFGDRRVPISSMKSMLGHCMGAASALEAIGCVLTLETGIYPPTIGYETPDPECDVDVVANVARRGKADIVLNNSLAFGGYNAVTVLREARRSSRPCRPHRAERTREAPRHHRASASPPRSASAARRFFAADARRRAALRRAAGPVETFDASTYPRRRRRRGARLRRRPSTSATRACARSIG